MHRYQILIEYVGTNFIGWQIQKKGNSVQGFVQSIISNILKEKIVLIGSGRTDAGVHALEQSAHFDCKKRINQFVDTEFLALDSREFRTYVKSIAPDIDMSTKYISGIGEPHNPFNGRFVGDADTQSQTPVRRCLCS